MATPTLPITAAISRDQREARRQGFAMQERANHGETLLETQDMLREPGYVIYVYNLLERDHWVHQTGFHLHIPACPKGQKFAFTTLPAFNREVYLKPGSTEYNYKLVDGRRAAMSLLNPASFPGTNWDSQLGNWTAEDQQGNNLNNYGCFWSLTKPDETAKLEGEIKIFRERCNKTMQALVAAAEQFAAANDLKSISPLMHFAMDYLGKAAPWHMAMYHMVNCPNCGEMVREGIAYHRNAFGEKCIIDLERYNKIVVAMNPPAPAAAPEPEPAVPVVAAAEGLGEVADLPNSIPTVETEQPQKRPRRT